MKTRYIRWLNGAIEAQLVATLASLPFLCAWGLPFSLLTLPANLVLLPLVTLFLFACSLCFFCALLSLPLSWPAQLANVCATLLISALSFGSKHWLICLPCPPMPLLICLCALLVWALGYIRTIAAPQRTLLLTGLLAGIWGTFNLLGILAPNVYRDGKIEIRKKSGKISIVDHGALSRSRKSTSYIRFELLPHLARQFGTWRIHEMVLEKPSKSSLLSIEELSKCATVDSLSFQREATTPYQRRLKAQILAKNSDFGSAKLTN